MTQEAVEGPDAAKPIRDRRLHAKGTYWNFKPKKVKSMLDEAAESMASMWSVTKAPTLEDLLHANQVFFSTDLSPLQSAAALQTLRTSLAELQYRVWEEVPLVITTKASFSIGRAEDGETSSIQGTIEVPWDFKPAPFVHFLFQNAESIAAARQRMRLFAQSFEELSSRVCAALDLDDVLVSCPHREAFATLQCLERNIDIVRYHNVSHVTLEIGDKFAVRDNGVIIVDHKALNKHPEQLKRWLSAIQPKMDGQQQRYRVAKGMLEEMMRLTTEIRSNIAPAGLDVFDGVSAGEYTYAQRLQWLRELHKISPSLARWDWSDVAFCVGPVDIDWQRNQFTLPHDFDGPAFLRYVEDIHRDASEKKHEELLARSAMDRERADLLLREGIREQQGSAILDDRQDEAAAAAGGSPKHSREALRSAAPQLEEYLSSSPNAVDPHSVERPLHHTVSFHSDDAASDQMKWEGFYESPYVSQRPQGDEDDIHTAYWATNRWHRKQAAKEVLEELRLQYGPSSKRWDYVKMGDLMGINDPKNIPRGFPVVAKGVKPGL
jgi:hypothetical protein